MLQVSHVTSFNQSALLQHSNATLKFVYNISNWYLLDIYKQRIQVEHNWLSVLSTSRPIVPTFHLQKLFIFKDT